MNTRRSPRKSRSWPFPCDTKTSLIKTPYIPTIQSRAERHSTAWVRGSLPGLGNGCTQVLLGALDERFVFIYWDEQKMSNDLSDKLLKY